MENYSVDRHFLKTYSKLPRKIRDRFDERARLLMRDPFHPLLNNHSVDRAYPGWRSINVTGDYRAIYAVEEEKVVFMRIGTHPQLY